MTEPITKSDRFFTATMWLAIATNVIGVSACLNASPEWRVAFLLTSAVTGASLLLSFVRPLIRRQPSTPSRWPLHVIVALATFWASVLVMPAVTKVSDGNWLRNMTLNNVKQSGLALRSYQDAYQHLPTDIRIDAGDPILSWRVQLCPFIEQAPLYEKFDRKEPWDGPTNLRLLERTPSVYLSPYSEEPEKTFWQGFVGSGTAFEPDRRKLSLNDDFPDGLANTILIVEANQLVPWSKPADIPYGPNVSMPSLGREYHKKASWPFYGYASDPGFHAVMADGSVRFLSADISEDTLRAMIVRNDGKP